MATTYIQEDPLTGDLFIEFPEDMMEELGWQIGDVVEWFKDNEDEQTWIIRRSNAPSVG